MPSEKNKKVIRNVMKDTMIKSLSDMFKNVKLDIAEVKT